MTTKCPNCGATVSVDSSIEAGICEYCKMPIISQKTLSSIACIFSGHDWHGCKCNRCGILRNEKHEWNGCKCNICGTNRNNNHRFAAIEGKSKKERCSVCGKERYNIFK